MLTYSDIKETDLFTFFNFSEISRTVDEEDNLIHIMLKPGGFIEFIDIYFIFTGDEVFKEGSLHLDRSWIGDEKEINIFAKDIVKSFIQDLIPPKDKQNVDDLVQILFKVKGSDETVLSVERVYGVKEISDPVSSMFVKALAGMILNASLELDTCKILFENSTEGSRSRLEVNIVHRI